MGGETEGLRRKELLYDIASLVPKRQAHILEAERDCQFPIAIVSIRKDGVVACSDFPMHGAEVVLLEFFPFLAL